MSDEELGAEMPEVVEPEVIGEDGKPENSETVDKPEPTPEEVEARKKEKLQRRFDKLTREKHEAIARAEHLEKMLTEGKGKKEEVPASLDRDNFDSDKEWIEAIADHKAEQKARAIIEAQARERQEAEKAEKLMTVEQKANKIFADAAEIGGYDEDDFNEIPFTSVMSEMILESEVAAKLVHHLAANLDLAEKIAGMSPMRQAAEIGKLEDALSKPAAVVKKSAAPEPIKPVSGAGKSYKGLSDDMSTDEWLRMRNKQLREK